MTFQDPRRAQFLREIGVGPLWHLRARQMPAPQPTPETSHTPAPQSTVAQSTVAQPAAAAQSAFAPQHTLAVRPEPAAWEAAVPDWATEATPVGTDLPLAGLDDEASVAGKPAADEIARMDWPALEAAVAACTKCRLCEGRTRTVFGTGDRQAKWLFVGEGPGRNEDQQGEPFVGPAGKLLDNMLAAMGLRRGENAYIANVVKCRPVGEHGGDRPPAPDEIATCLPYLERQIALLRPDVIVALGKSAALALLQAAADTPVAKLRGQVHRHAGIPLVVTYHPAYLLRAPEEKGKAWRDLCLAMTSHADAAAGR